MLRVLVMKKIIRLTLVLLILVSFGITSACGRQPTPKRTADIMESFFKKYGKEYPESIFGQTQLQGVQILHIDEVHKNLVAVYAILELQNGMAMQTRFSIQKKPFGWRAVSWENMGYAMRRPAGQ